MVNKNSLQFLSEINKRYLRSITIYFRVHHSDPKFQEVFMGVKNIRDRLIEAINIVKSFELPFTIGMTPTKLNFNDLDNMFELSLKLGAKSFNLSEFIPIGRGKNSIDLDLDPEQYKILKYWIKKKEESYRLKGFISHHPHYAIFIRPDLWFNELYTGCTAGIYNLGISSNGNITPCPLMNYVLGNIRNQSIIEIWNNHPLLAKLRNREVKGKCASCLVKYKCGGCRCVAYAYTNDPLAEDVKCPFNEYEIKSFLTYIKNNERMLSDNIIEYNNLINKIKEYILRNKNKIKIYLLPNPYNYFSDSEIIVLNRITQTYSILDGQSKLLYEMLHNLNCLDENKSLTVSEVENIFYNKYGVEINYNDISELILNLVAVMHES